MAPVDGILNIVDRQGANELRLGSDREPQMFADGAPKRLVIPKTSTETLRELLGEILSKEREKRLVEQGQMELVYEPPGLGAFRVKITRRRGEGAELELDAVFLRGRPRGSTTLPAPPPVMGRPHRAPAAEPVSSARPDPAPATKPEPAPPTRPDREPATHPEAAHAVAAAGTTSAGDATEELAALVAAARALRASDVHLMEGAAPLARIDGRLVPLPGGRPVEIARLLGPRLATEARQRMASGASADLGFSIEGTGRCRLNVFQTAGGLAAAVRLLRGEPPALAELHAPIPLDDLVDLPHGLVIVCGPTGCGKSTTLAALAHDALARRPSMLITLEDPIEYTLAAEGAPGVVRQRQVGRDVRDFATGLRDALREDPDLLLIGEMRDPETIGLALTAAETGHLVLASLHSRSAPSAIERIVDTYAPERQQQIRVQLADSLRAVVAQRLVPRASGEGRVLALEVLRVNHAVANAIREARTSNIVSAIQSGKREGMLPLDRCLADLVQRRQITIEAARAVANDPAALGQYLSA